jgi:hypothetical protein
MDAATIVLGAAASALFGAYFLGSFAFVAYVLRKYDDVKDELRLLRGRLDNLAVFETLLKRSGENFIWRGNRLPGDDGGGAHGVES